jgi:hypothetical protein
MTLIDKEEDEIPLIMCDKCKNIPPREEMNSITHICWKCTKKMSQKKWRYTNQKENVGYIDRFYS